MDDEPTCGKGLAANAPLPQKLGDLVAAVADVLEGHMSALDLTDAAGIQEHAAYAQLVADHRRVARQLAAIAREMTGYRDLPMARHDAAAMAAPAVSESFRTFVTIERELLTLLRGRVEQDQQMLAGMGAAR